MFIKKYICITVATKISSYCVFFYIEDWSNDAENSDLHHRNKLHKKIILQ